MRHLPLAVLAVLLIPAEAAAEPARGELRYATRAACESAKTLPDGACREAFLNAEAEFDEKAPRFPARGACERLFGRCMIGISGAAGYAGRGEGVYFIPRWGGVRVTVRAPGSATVLPIVEGRALAFTPRSALKPDAVRSPTRGASARAAFMASVAPKREAPARTRGGPVKDLAPAPDAATPPPENGAPVLSFPVDPGRWERMKRGAGG